MDRVGENARGVLASRLLSSAHDFTIDSLAALAFNSYLAAFEGVLPRLFEAYRLVPDSLPVKRRVEEAVSMLRTWDRRCSVNSIPTTLAVCWSQEMERTRRAGDGTSSDSLRDIKALETVIDTLEADFGTWKVPWGEVNRFQRISGDIVQTFSDESPSTPVGFASGRLGSLAAFESRRYPGTKRMYGSSGNSFVAVVEFADTVKARAITAGGESADVRSPHFGDQVDRFVSGHLREVYLSEEVIARHAVSRYHPGE
jgi:acyl-homoserine-lactone acylase